MINLIEIKKLLLLKEESPLHSEKIQPSSNTGEQIGKELLELNERLRERDRRESDEELAEYANSRRQKTPVTNPILGWTGGDDRIHTKNPAGVNLLIPEHLSEQDKEILRQFYDL